MLVTYAHRRLDTNQVFYVGKGSLRRAYEQRGHNKYWNAVTKKHGYEVNILAKWNTDLEAFAHEKFLIACFKDMGHPLTNATDGGEGVSGWKWSVSQREKLVKALTGRAGTFKGKKHTEETRKKISAILLGRESPRKGVVVSDSARLKMSKSAKKHFSSEVAVQKQRDLSRPQMRKVFAEGEEFESVHALAKAINKPLSTTHRWVMRGWQDKIDNAIRQIKGAL
jgi:hypothetical protein